MRTEMTDKELLESLIIIRDAFIEMNRLWDEFEESLQSTETV